MGLEGQRKTRDEMRVEADVDAVGLDPIAAPALDGIASQPRQSHDAHDVVAEGARRLGPSWAGRKADAIAHDQAVLALTSLGQDGTQSSVDLALEPKRPAQLCGRRSAPCSKIMTSRLDVLSENQE
jgi:hypothetical protein